MRPEPRHPADRASVTLRQPGADRAETASGELPSPARLQARDHARKALRGARNGAVPQHRSLRARPAKEFRTPRIEQEKRPFSAFSSSLLSQMVAGFGPVAVDEFWRGHAALALELNLDQLQRRVSVFVFTAVFAVALAAANEQPRSLDRDFSGRQLDRMLPGSSAVHLQRFALKHRERPRPRLKSAQAVECG